MFVFLGILGPMPGGGPRLDRRARIQFGAGTFWRKTMKNQPGTMTNQPRTMKREKRTKSFSLMKKRNERGN